MIRFFERKMFLSRRMDQGYDAAGIVVGSDFLQVLSLKEVIYIYEPQPYREKCLLERAFKKLLSSWPEWFKVTY